MDRRKELIDLVTAKALMRGDFVLSSGARSTFYIDLRKVSLSAAGVLLIAELVLDLLSEGPPVEMIGGPTIGADPIVGAVAAISHSRGRAMDAFLVRKSTKDHGTQMKIEGPPVAGKKVAVIDDVGTTGSSLIGALEAAREGGAEVTRALVVLDRREGAGESVRAAGLELESLITLADIMD
jgi:orotate phosphoribosyltransferase